MEKYELQKLRDLPIEGVAERLGLRVSRHKCLCPFHADNHPSLSFKVSKNTFRCFVCGESGGTIDLVMKYLRKDFLDACRWLSESWGQVHDSLTRQQNHATCPIDSPPKPFDASKYERFFERPWLNGEARKFLFEERRLDARVVRWCRLTSWKDKQQVPWLQIPYYDREGKLVGVQNRNLVKGAIPRFRFPQGSECSIYNLPVLNMLKPGDELFITEGCSDCWAMLSAGHKAIAIPSATLLSRKDKEQLSILNSQLSITFHMFPDRDEPGERLFLQLREVLPSLVHHQLPQDCKDFSDYYLKLKIVHCPLSIVN
jgi:DNA primase